MSIASFTDPYQDELLYSAYARFSERMRFPDISSERKELFGRENSSPVVDLPCRLDNLISALPPYHQYTADRLIDDYTLWRFYAPFISPERALLVRNEMRSGTGKHLRERLGLKATRIKLPSRLRFCPECVKEDRKRNRETYWHRIHQATGVEVCQRHAVFLENSNASWYGRNYKFYTAERNVLDVQPRRLSPSNVRDSAFLNIAQNVGWLLDWRGLAPNPSELRDRYFNLLLAHGFAYYNGRIRVTKLLKAFEDFYTRNLLAELQCPLKSPGNGWLINLLLKDQVSITQHPIYHILLMNFLGRTAEEIFTSFIEFKPFGEGPWPCLNHASSHFGQLLITDCRVTDNLTKGKTGKPMGTFRCKCDHIYVRVGPDTSEGARFRADSVRFYGRVWERSLLRLWENTNTSLTEIANNLGVSILTVIRHAIRLGLPMNSHGARPVGRQTLERYKNWRQTLEDAKEYYRSEWLKVLKAKPDASRKQLMDKANFLYLWLRKNDNDWIEAHLPPKRKVDRKVTHLDWRVIDSELSAKVELAVKDIKERPGRPVRISKSAIIRLVGNQPWLEMRLNKLPKTAQVLATHLESQEALLLRRAQWAAKAYAKENIYPTKHQFTQRIGARTISGRTALVQRAINIAVEGLKEPVLQHPV